MSGELIVPGSSADIEDTLKALFRKASANDDFVGAAKLAEALLKYKKAEDKKKRTAPSALTA